MVVDINVIIDAAYAPFGNNVGFARQRLESRSIEFLEKLGSRHTEAPDHPKFVEALDQLGNGRVGEPEEDTTAQATQ